MPVFLWENSGFITCLHYNDMRMSSYNEYKNAVPENLFKGYETFHYNSPSNKCKTKTTKLHSNETHLQKHKTLSKEDQHLIQLVKRSIAGDADAFLELMEKNSLAMYKVARGILDNDEDAADAMQDTILTCFEKIHTLKNPEYFKTWMIRILINECNKIHRHYKNFSRAEELPEVPGQDMSIAEFEFKEMLGMLDESYRIILVLYYVEGFRIADIASILNMNENTVKTRLARARIQLKQEYALSENTDLQERSQQTKVRKLTGEKSAGDNNGILKTQTGITGNIAVSARKG